MPGIKVVFEAVDEGKEDDKLVRWLVEVVEAGGARERPAARRVERQRRANGQKQAPQCAWNNDLGPISFSLGTVLANDGDGV